MTITQHSDYVQYPEPAARKPELANSRLTAGSPRRVLMLLSNAFDPDPRVHQEAKALVEAGYDVTIFCWDRDYQKISTELIDGIRVERIYVRSKHGRGNAQVLFLPIFWLKALAKALFTRYDVVHAHDFDTLPVGFCIARIKRAKVVYDSHESYVDMLAQNVNTTLKRFLVKLEDFFITRTDLVITVGPTLSKNFKARGAKRVEIVGNWKDKASYAMPPETIASLRKQMGIPKEKIVISYIGHLHPRRKIIELMNTVCCKKTFFLLIGGYGELAAEVEEYAKRYDNIKHLGYVAPNEVPYFTGLSDVIYSAFDLNHPMAKYLAPNKLFDALAAGKALLAGNCGDTAILVKEENCGILLGDYQEADFDEALDAISVTRDVLDLYCRNASKAAEKYNWDKARSVLLRVYP